MKKVLLFLLPVVLAVIVFFSLLLFLSKKTPGKGALQVTSLPQASVYLNNKLIGKTPICKCDPQDMLLTGNYRIRLVPQNGTSAVYEDTIPINPLVLTVVDRSMTDPGKSTGSVITLSQTQQKNSAQLAVDVVPSGANLILDANPAGVSPLSPTTITDSDHEINIEEAGYAKKTIRIHGVNGYLLHVLAYLATDLTPQPTPSVAATTSALPTPLVGSGPTLTLGVNQPQVTILDTPTGFLRVRDSASLGGAEIAQVHPGDHFAFVAQEVGWYQIKLADGRLGWVSSTYAKKQ